VASSSLEIGRRLAGFTRLDSEQQQHLLDQVLPVRPPLGKPLSLGIAPGFAGIRDWVLHSAIVGAGPAHRWHISFMPSSPARSQTVIAPERGHAYFSRQSAPVSDG